MPLGREVGLGPGDIVLDGEPAPPKKGHSHPFSAHVCCGQTAGWIKMQLGTEVILGPGHIALDEDAATPHPKGVLPKFSARLLQLNGWMDHLVRR